MQTRELSAENWVYQYLPKTDSVYRCCSICWFGTFVTSNQFTHALTHRYMCRICNQQFELDFFFFTHFLRFHFVSKQIWVPQIQLFFNSLRSPEISCPICMEPHSIQQHQRLVETTDCKYKCLTCNCRLNSQKLLQTHKRLHRYGEKGSPFTCKVCSDMFWFKNTLYLHYTKSPNCGAVALGLHLSIIKSKDAQTQVPKQLKTDICRVVEFRSKYLELMAQRRQVLLEREERVLNSMILERCGHWQNSGEEKHLVS